jgi:hypothetical protein
MSKEAFWRSYLAVASEIQAVKKPWGFTRARRLLQGPPSMEAHVQVPLDNKRKKQVQLMLEDHDQHKAN